MTRFEIPAHANNPQQDEVRQWFLKLGSRAWLPLMTSVHDDQVNAGTFCALAPTTYRPQALRKPGWDLLHNQGGPGFSQGSDGSGGWSTEYHRIGAGSTVEPLIIDRDFHGVRPSYRELSEEFRLYHNLYDDSAASRFLRIQDDGTTLVAAHMGSDEIQVLTSLVRQYQAGRQLDLLLFIDSVVYYDPSWEPPGEQEWHTEELNAALFCGASMIAERPFTRFLGTRVLPAPALEKAGVWPFEPTDRHYPEFVIGQDDQGGSVRHTCDPDLLANYFGANPGSPHYLTPVYFRI